MRRLAVTALLAVLALIGVGQPAFAHNTLISSDPEEDGKLPASPEVITLTFDQPVQAGEVNQIAVTGPDGSQWATGTVEVDSNVVTRPVAPLGPEGTYTIGYSVLSADGHPVRGEIPFTLTEAGEGAPPAGSQPDTTAEPAQDAEEAPEDSGGVPFWVWIAGAAVLLVAGLLLALRLGREQE